MAAFRWQPWLTLLLALPAGALTTQGSPTRSASRPALALPLEAKFKYHCALCSIRLEKKKHLEQHLSGRKHREALERADTYWASYQRSGWFDPAAPPEAVKSTFSFDAFTEGLRRRTRSGGPAPTLQRSAEGSGSAEGGGCICPSVHVSELPAAKRAMLYRYLSERVSDTGYADVLLELGGRYDRVKEILESVESYLHLKSLIARHRRVRITSVYDLACGHGLVGLLLAASFPRLQVFACDLKRRDAFQAQLAAWEALGKPLCNVRFVEGNFTKVLSVGDAGFQSAAGAAGGGGLPRVGPSSLVFSIHGCTTANSNAIELARRAGAGWMVVPCCLQQEQCLPSALTMRLSDSQRYLFLCGAVGATYGADVIASLEPRVTPRSMVICRRATGEDDAAEL